MPIRLQNWLLSALTAAFLAWSAAIWTAISGLQGLHADVREAIVQVDTLKTLIERHEAQPWHTRAGEEINRLRGHDDR